MILYKAKFVSSKTIRISMAYVMASRLLYSVIVGRVAYEEHTNTIIYASGLQPFEFEGQFTSFI